MVDSAFEVFFISFSKCSALELHAGIFEAFWKTRTLSMLIRNPKWSEPDHQNRISWIISLSCLYEMMVVPSRELTYTPPKMAFWRWFSFSRLVGYVSSLEGIYQKYALSESADFKHSFFLSFHIQRLDSGGLWRSGWSWSPAGWSSDFMGI